MLTQAKNNTATFMDSLGDNCTLIKLSLFNITDRFILLYPTIFIYDFFSFQALSKTKLTFFLFLNIK